MIGPPKPRRLDVPITVSLEELVPTDTFYRDPDAKLDLSFVREWVIDHYAERSRPSIIDYDSLIGKYPEHRTGS